MVYNYLNSEFDKKKHVRHDLQIMVRTRGLGRALGRVIAGALGRQDDHHADDIPQGRRPSTSACRQREAAPVAEDVPEITEDIPAHGAEGLAGDGAKGSAADDSEGFPSGPHDSLVLTSFVEHVIHNIWIGKVLSFLGKVIC